MTDWTACAPMPTDKWRRRTKCCQLRLIDADVESNDLTRRLMIYIGSYRTNMRREVCFQSYSRTRAFSPTLQYRLQSRSGDPTLERENALVSATSWCQSHVTSLAKSRTAILHCPERPRAVRDKQMFNADKISAVYFYPVTSG
jgi:hypothetical protein